MIKLKIEKTPQENPAEEIPSWDIERVARKQKDPRINTPRFSWVEFLGMWFFFMVIGTGALLIMSEYIPGMEFSVAATFSTLGYFALMAVLFVVMTILWRRLVYERPIRLLGAAAQRVAQGDFSVHLPKKRKNEKKKDYIDVMFEDFNTMVDELSSIETLKDDFVGNVSHEIKTPLATIENYASALQKSNLSDGEREEYTKAISEASQRLSLLVSNILRLNKLDNQTILAKPAPYDLSEQLRGCVLGFEDAWEKKNLDIQIDLDDECIINKEEALLEPVWNNLISNAIKFTEPGGTVKISQRADAAHVRVDIIDTGIGMDEAAQRRIFDKFYQGDTSHAGEGNGLGLALAARALNLAGGEMIVSSTPGEGATFTVWLANS